jgi:ectoine hydroxylase-related dioxygenase (phytanoyl-CoA dioxygenase family)
MAGSHRGGYVDPTRGPDNMFTIAGHELDRYEPFDAVMEPGDALLFSDLTFHRAHMNRSKGVRWSIDIRFATASPAIISKSERGYHCASKDPRKVESFETWAARYAEPEPVWYASSALTGDLSQDAAALGVSRAELEVF